MYHQFSSLFMTQNKTESSSEVVCFMVTFRPSIHPRELV